MFTDFMPYICTFPSCTKPDQLYASRRQWFEHELQVHRRQWHCGKCNSDFLTKASMIEHLGQQHEKDLVGVDCSSAAGWCESAITVRQSCPLCPNADTYEPIQLRRHLGRHLQQIALFILPHSMKDDQSEVKDIDSEMKQKDLNSAEGVLQADSENTTFESGSISSFGSHKRGSGIVGNDLETENEEEVNCAILEMFEGSEIGI